MVILCFSDNYQFIPWFGAICFQKFWSCVFTADFKNFYGIWTDMRQIIAKVITDRVQFLCLYNKLNMFVSQPIPYVKCSSCYGVGFSGTAKTYPKSLSTQTTLYPKITTAIYWCLLMRLAMASHQYPKTASTKHYIGLIYFVLLIIAIAWMRMKYCW